MNNCKKCGSTKLDNIENQTAKGVAYQIECKECGSSGGIYYSLYGALQSWQNNNSPEYKTIPELRAMFEKHFLGQTDRSPSGEYKFKRPFSEWMGYLECAQDNGLLPPNVDPLKERVK